MKKVVAVVANLSMYDVYLTMNHFERFNIERSFDIELKILKKNYLQLQLLYHPDRAKSEEEKNNFLNLSVSLNEGYKILLNDLTRAEYLLELENLALTEDTQISNVGNLILVKALEDREELEEINNLVDLKKFEQIKLIEEDQILVRLRSYFLQRNYNEARSETIKLKYHKKLLIDIKNKIEKFNAAI